MHLLPPNDSPRTVMNRIDDIRFHRLFAALFLLLGLTFVSSFLTAEEDFPIGLAQGVMVGEVRTDSAILQSRLTSTSTLVDRRWSGIIGVEGVARFELSIQPDFRDSIQTEWLKSLPENDYIVKLRVADLRPDTRYHYRLSYGPKQDQLRQSMPGSFRTLAGRNGTGPFSIAVVTGMNYTAFHHTGNSHMLPYRGPDKELGYPALASILSLKPDFFVGTGDNVYYDFPGGGFGHLQRGRAETQHQMRMKHQEQYSQPRFLELFRGVATYWMKDDHDHRFNDSDPFNPTLLYERFEAETYAKTNLHPRLSGSGSAPSHELGLRIFREQLPVVDPRDPEAVTYRTLRVSRGLQIWIVEGRDYRSPNDMPDGPEKTIWGTKQRNWLKQTLLESEATFKLLISATPMVGPDSTAKSVVAWIGAEMEFALSQAVASGDAFEHRPPECGHCVQNFLADLDLRDLSGEAARFELGADHALPTTDLRFYPAALVVPCGHLPGHAAVAADLGNMAIPNGWIPRRLRSDHCVLRRRYNHIQGLPIPLPQHIPYRRSIIGAVSQKARDRSIELIQEPG